MYVCIYIYIFVLVINYIVMIFLHDSSYDIVSYIRRCNWTNESLVATEICKKVC